jgi:HEAT repeat protein
MTKPLTGTITMLVLWCPLFALPPAGPQADSSPMPPNVARARALLNEGFESSDYTVRVQAITAASMVGRREALLKRLEGLLQDKNVEVRLATVHALADLHSPQCKESLRTALKEDKTPEVSFAVAKVLAGLGDPAGTSALMDVYEGNRKTRSGALKKEERSVLEGFHSAPSAVMFVVGKGIGYVPVVGAGEGFSAITMLLKDSGVSDRANVLFILGRTKSSESLDLLRKALQDDDWSVRAVAAQMIAQTARTELRDSLPPLFEDKNHKVRFRAAGAYLHLLLVAAK